MSLINMKFLIFGISPLNRNGRSNNEDTGNRQNDVTFVEAVDAVFTSLATYWNRLRGGAISVSPSSIFTIELMGGLADGRCCAHQNATLHILCTSSLQRGSWQTIGLAPPAPSDRRPHTWSMRPRGTTVGFPLMRHQGRHGSCYRARRSGGVCRSCTRHAFR